MTIGFSIIYSIRDEKGRVSTTEVRVPAATPFAEVVEFGGAMALLIDPLISGQITRIGLVFDYTLIGGIKTAPVAGSDVEEGARFSFLTENNFPMRMRLPTFLESLIVPGTKLVDTADTDVATFITAMTEGIDLAGVLGIVEPSDSREEDVVSLVEAVEQFLSS